MKFLHGYFGWFNKHEETALCYEKPIKFIANADDDNDNVDGGKSSNHESRQLLSV